MSAVQLLNLLGGTWVGLIPSTSPHLCDNPLANHRTQVFTLLCPRGKRAAEKYQSDLERVILIAVPMRNYKQTGIGARFVLEVTHSLHCTQRETGSGATRVALIVAPVALCSATLRLLVA